MSDYTIEKNVPMPARAYYREGFARYPLAAMEVGDSFVVPRTERRTVENALGHFKKKTGRQFSRRTIGEQVRIWRIA